MPEGCIIGLSTAVRSCAKHLQKEISEFLHVVLSKCSTTMCHDACQCVSFDPVSDLLDSQKSMLRNCHSRGNANLCCCRLALLSCTRTCLDISSFQGTLTCGGAPGVPAAIPARFCCCSSWATRRWAIVAINFRIVKVQIKNQIHPRLNKSACSKLKSCHPSL